MISPEDVAATPPLLNYYTTLRDEFERCMVRAEARGMERAAKMADERAGLMGSLQCSYVADDIRDEAAKTEPAKETCEWFQHDSEDFFDTSCGTYLDGPKTSGMNYCCFCGKPISVCPTRLGVK